MKTFGSCQSSIMSEHKTKDCAGLRPYSASMFALSSVPLKFDQVQLGSLSTTREEKGESLGTSRNGPLDDV